MKDPKINLEKTQKVIFLVAHSVIKSNFQEVTPFFHVLTGYHTTEYIT